MEDFVTYEQAVKLKELGLDIPVNHYYKDNHLIEIYGNLSNYCNVHERYVTGCFSAPTLAQAAKWLRDVKHIIIAIIPKYEIQCNGTYAWEYWYEIYNSTGKRLYAEPAGTYEYAMELAIDKALELLTEKQ